MTPVVLDAYTAVVLRLMAAAYPDLGRSVTDATEARRQYRAARFPGGPEMAAVADWVVPGDPPVPVRVYWPRTAPGPQPVVVYSHGGGFVLCDLDSHDGVCRLLADGAGAVVVSVDYRRAPEHPFPAACDDVYTVTQWAATEAAQWGGDPERLAVAGDSAGGALAAATCLRARDHAGPDLRGQVLIYPVTDCLAERPDVPDALLTVDHMRWFDAQYLADAADAHHPYASPLRARDLTGLPPALVLTAEHDPLRPEGEAYGRALRRAGVPTTVRRIPGMFHGLFGHGTHVPAARRAERVVCAALRRALRDDRHRETRTGRHEQPGD